jgi:hypothetical protein
MCIRLKEKEMYYFKSNASRVYERYLSVQGPNIKERKRGR